MSAKTTTYGTIDDTAEGRVFLPNQFTDPRLSAHDDGDAPRPLRRVPWRRVGWALGMLLLGIACLALGVATMDPPVRPRRR